MSRFRDDNSQQQRVRDAVLGPGLYGPHSLDGRYVYLDKGRLATILQKRYAVDTFMQSKNGAALAIEEKIVRWPGKKYEAITLETKSCTVPGHESDGWMVYGKADWLHWVMCQDDGTVLSYFMPFPKLQKIFWEALEENEHIFPKTTTTQHNRTECRVVNLAWIRDAVGLHPAEGRRIYPTPEGVEIVKAYNGTHYKS